MNKSRSQSIDETSKPAAVKSEQQVASSNETKNRVPKELLDRLSDELLENTKQLGLFDEVRMKLLNDLEYKEEFLTIRDEFKYELDSFCSNEKNLKLPRNKLREKLNLSLTSSSSKSDNNNRQSPTLNKLIRDYVSSVARNKKAELRELFNKQAYEYLQKNVEIVSERASQIEPDLVESKQAVMNAAKKKTSAIEANNDNDYDELLVDSLLEEAAERAKSVQLPKERTSTADSRTETTIAPIAMEIVTEPEILSQIPLPELSPIIAAAVSEATGHIVNDNNSSIGATDKKSKRKLFKSYKQTSAERSGKIKIQIRADSVCYRGLQAESIIKVPYK